MFASFELPFKIYLMYCFIRCQIENENISQPFDIVLIPYFCRDNCYNVKIIFSLILFTYFMTLQVAECNNVDIGTYNTIDDIMICNNYKLQHSL